MASVSRSETLSGPQSHLRYSVFGIRYPRSRTLNHFVHRDSSIRVSRNVRYGEVVSQKQNPRVSFVCFRRRRYEKRWDGIPCKEKTPVSRELVNFGSKTGLDIPIRG